MNYTQLTDSYKYDTIADAIYAREVEYFHYDFDRANFEYMIANTDSPELSENLTKRLSDTCAQMQTVLLVIAALRAQITDLDAYEAAVQRVTDRRKEKESG